MQGNISRTPTSRKLLVVVAAHSRTQCYQTSSKPHKEQKNLCFTNPLASDNALEVPFGESSTLYRAEVPWACVSRGTAENPRRARRGERSDRDTGPRWRLQQGKLGVC